MSAPDATTDSPLRDFARAVKAYAAVDREFAQAIEDAPPSPCVSELHARLDAAFVLMRHAYEGIPWEERMDIFRLGNMLVIVSHVDEISMVDLDDIRDLKGYLEEDA